MGRMKMRAERGSKDFPLRSFFFSTEVLSSIIEKNTYFEEAIMNRFLRNWTYPKHAAAVSGIYLGIGVIGNALLGKPTPQDEKTCCPVTTCRRMTKVQRVFNIIIAFCYVVDMSAAYLGIKHWKNQYK